MTAEPPDVDLLADLDAGLLDAATARRARADPAASAVLDALAGTRAELAALPRVPVPPAFAARWTEALRTAAPGTDTAVPTDDGSASDSPGSERPTPAPGVAVHETAAPATRARTRPDRPRSCGDRPGRRAAGPGRHARPALLAAALLVGVLVAGNVLARPAPSPSVSGVEFAGAGLAAIGAGDTGALADPVRRAGCLRAIGITTDPPLLGGRRILLDGRPAVLLVLGTGELGVFDAVAVDPGCGASGGELLSRARVGR